MEIINSIINFSSNVISNGGILFGFFSVFLECFIPFLPLSVFVMFNVNAFGMFFGILISWLATCFGSFLCYFLFYYFDIKFFSQKRVDSFQKITFSQLVLLITLPFTPSFLINVLAGISNISIEKYIMALLIGKMFSIIFWGYIGKSILYCLTDFRSIIYLILTLCFAYLLSKVVCVKMNLE